MIERAIENWLTNTNERNYLTPLAQTLLQRGHTILHVSRHGPLEQGKDIITKAPNGELHAYQTKTGNIGLKEFRDYRGEILDLIQLPVTVRGVSTSTEFKPFLVINGEFSDPAKNAIQSFNNGMVNKKFPPLNTIQKNELLQWFIEAQGRFIPLSFDDFQTFLSLYLSDGRDFIDKNRLSDFYSSAIFSQRSDNRSDNKNTLSGSVIINSYMLNNFQKELNEYAVFEAWTFLLSNLIRFALKNEVRETDWETTKNLILNEILESLIELKKEVLERDDYLEGEMLGDGGVLYNVRFTLTMGALAALELYNLTNVEGYADPGELFETISKNAERLFFWGESAFPFFFTIIKYAEKYDAEYAKTILRDVCNILISRNHPSTESPFRIPNPYYSPQDFLNVFFGLKPSLINFDHFIGSSYSLKPAILMLARRNEKQFLEDRWRFITRVFFNEFVPANPEDAFLWSIPEGSNHTFEPRYPESWNHLTEEASDISDVPEIFQQNYRFLPFFVLVFPHRANAKLTTLLDLLY